MTFKEAFKLMKDGKMVKLPSWSGYWEWDSEKETIMMHCRADQSDNGESVVDIRDTQRVEYTINNMLSNAWIEATEKNTPILGGSRYVDFVTALEMSVLYKLPIKEKNSCDEAFIVDYATVPGNLGISIKTVGDKQKSIGLDEIQSKEWEICD